MPKQKPFACKHCGRKFSMAAHLARHSRAHSTGRSEPSRKRSAVRRATATASPFAGVIASLIDSHRALVAERDALSVQIAALEAAMRAVSGGQNPRATRGRPSRNGKTTGDGSHRPGSLKDHVQRVLAQAEKPMGVSNIAAAVVKSGFKSKNKTLRTSVGIALADMPGVRRVRRGVYGP